MNLIYKYRLTLIGVFLGAIGGYLYYHFIGCASGSCAITSVPLNSTIYGAVMGALLLNMFKKESPDGKRKGSQNKETDKI